MEYISLTQVLLRIPNVALDLIYACLHLCQQHGLGGKALFHIVHIFFQCVDNRTKLLLKLFSVGDGFGEFLQIGFISPYAAPDGLPKGRFWSPLVPNSGEGEKEAADHQRGSHLPLCLPRNS